MRISTGRVRGGGAGAIERVFAACGAGRGDTRGDRSYEIGSRFSFCRGFDDVCVGDAHGDAHDAARLSAAHHDFRADSGAGGHKGERGDAFGGGSATLHKGWGFGVGDAFYAAPAEEYR